MTVGAGIAKTVLPKGFFASGLNSGVRRYRPDVGLITSDVPATGVAVYTQSTCSGEHIKYCQKVLPSENIQALLTNSGQANTAVGPEGAKDNMAMVEAVAKALNLQNDQVLTASTGVIGQRVDIEKVNAIVPSLVEAQVNTAESFATAVMTTDLVPKTVTTTVKLSQGEVRLTGIAKGSGMIHPNMATMLGYLLTDLKLSAGVAQDLLKKAVNPTFNMISVDGEPSTNDTVFLLANGEAGVTLASDEDYDAFLTALKDVSTVLAKAIARDGEGATKLIEVQLKGAPSEAEAAKWARSITVSPLIKTAIHGRDPNWGRIVGRLGGEGVPAEAFDKLTLKIQQIVLIDNGNVQTGKLQELSNSLRSDEVLIEIDLGIGGGISGGIGEGVGAGLGSEQTGFSATAWGCDLSKKYVEINAEYTS